VPDYAQKALPNEAVALPLQVLLADLFVAFFCAIFVAFKQSIFNPDMLTTAS
jgi:hypothetical protein